MLCKGKPFITPYTAMRKYILLLFVLCSYLTQAQTITVPNNIYFADQRLRVTDSGQREIQRMVDALTKYPKYYQVKVDLADTYFPIIERIFPGRRAAGRF